VELQNYSNGATETITCCYNLKFQSEDTDPTNADGYPYSFNLLTGGYYDGEECTVEVPNPSSGGPITNFCCPDALREWGLIGGGDCSFWQIRRVLSHSDPLACGTIFTIEGSGDTINEDGEIVSAEPEELPEAGAVGDVVKFGGTFYTWLEIKDENGDIVSEGWEELGENGSGGAACLDDGESCTGCGTDDCGGIWPASQEFPPYPEFKSVRESDAHAFGDGCIYNSETDPVWPWDWEAFPDGNPYTYPNLIAGQGYGDSAYNLSICNTAIGGGKYKQNLKFKIAHAASPTCYLKVWVYKKYTFLPCKTLILSGGIEYVANPPCPTGEPWGGIIECPSRARRVFDFGNPVVWYELFTEYEYESTETFTDPFDATPKCADLTIATTPSPTHLKMEECEEYIVDETEHEILSPDVSGTTVELVFTYSYIKNYQPDPPDVRAATPEWAWTAGSKKDGYPNLI
jgi:hypothetical protein